jgi:ABC-type multidrug transport system ATPase subunit
MDEAERCTRLAILDAGRVVADGTPRELMRNLPGRTLRVIDTPTARSAARARGLPGVIAGVAQIGASLRLLQHPATTCEARIAARLRRGDPGKALPAPPISKTCSSPPRVVDKASSTTEAPHELARLARHHRQGATAAAPRPPDLRR